MADENFVAFLTDALQNASNSMKPGAAFYIWHADSQGFNFRTAVKNIGWETRQCLIWNKNSLVLGRQDYQWKHEPCLYGWKEGAAHYFTNKRNLTTVMEWKLNIESMSKAEMKDLLLQLFGGDTPTTVIDCDKPKKNPDHPTMKPVPLIGKLISNSSRRKDIVLDIFGGSGTAGQVLPNGGVRTDLCRRHHQAMGRVDRAKGSTHQEYTRTQKVNKHATIQGHNDRESARQS